MVSVVYSNLNVCNNSLIYDLRMRLEQGPLCVAKIISTSFRNVADIVSITVNGQCPEDITVTICHGDMKNVIQEILHNICIHYWLSWRQLLKYITFMTMMTAASEAILALYYSAMLSFWMMSSHFICVRL
jgi:hypothetical protein